MSSCEGWRRFVPASWPGWAWPVACGDGGAQVEVPARPHPFPLYLWSEQPGVLGGDVCMSPAGGRRPGGWGHQQRGPLREAGPGAVLLQPPAAPRVHQDTAGAGGPGSHAGLPGGEPFSRERGGGERPHTAPSHAPTPPPTPPPCPARWTSCSSKTSGPCPTSSSRSLTTSPSRRQAWPRCTAPGCTTALWWP